MRYGIETKNLDKGNITISGDLRAYRYLGKYIIPSLLGDYVTVDVICNGVPQIYFQVPYNITAQDVGVIGIDSYLSRTGVALSKLQQINSTTWRVALIVNNFNGPDLNLYMRVFGRVDLNPPTGGARYGLEVYNTDRQLIFSSAARMLRLAGDTYNTQLSLPWQLPFNYETDRADMYDTSVNLPFNMAGKSICANTRGSIYNPYNVGGYMSDGQWVNQYQILKFHTLYWANSSTLYTRRISTSITSTETTEILTVDTSQCQEVFSRLSVIDNSKFP